MPFAVFRRHQKKLLAVFGILAMVGFVLSDSISRWGGGAAGRNANPVVVELYGKKIHRSDLQELGTQRMIANRFVTPITRSPDYFGGMTTSELVDAYILKHEADRLGIPSDREFAKTWLKRNSRGMMNQAMFDSLINLMGRDVDPEQVLYSLASQIRLQQAQDLLGNPIVTPLDIFQTYRDQNERSSFKVVSFPVANYTDKVADPSDSEARAYFDKYKDVLPTPASETPGFKTPRQIKVEVLSVDTAALSKQIEAKLTDADLRTYYENHKAELTPARELPDDIFANDPKAALTPPVYRPFDQVRETIVVSLAREKAQDEVTDKFDRIKDNVINKFADNYHLIQSEIDDAKKAGEPSKLTLPASTDLAGVAKENGLTHEISPLLTQSEAENYGQISLANAGSSPSLDDPKFATVIFDDKNLLYDSLDFSDLAGRRYLVRKIADLPPHSATYDEVKGKVIAAWKLEKARSLAEKAASEALTKVKADGGTIKEAVLLGRPVFAMDGLTRKRSGLPSPATGMFGESTPSDLPQIPFATDKLREDLFALAPGGVLLESNAPKDTYYVITLARRDPVDFASLYSPTASPFAYMFEATQVARRAQQERWMKHLRTEAGVPENWTPPGESEKAARRA